MSKLIYVGEIDFDSLKDMEKIEEILEENGYMIATSGNFGLKILRYKNKNDEIRLPDPLVF